MTSLTTTAPTDDALLSRAGRRWALLLALLFVVLHQHFLRRMAGIALEEWNNWSHAFMLPVISLLYVHRNRDQLAALTPRPSIVGLLVLFAGLFSYAWWLGPGANDMLQGYSMIVSLLGLVLLVLGPTLLSKLWFPVLYLALGVKVSPRLWEQLAWKLQLLASHCATLLMRGLGVDASVRGSTIELSLIRNGLPITETLNVAEACSGLRMLMAFVALGAAMAFLIDRPWWQRLVMVLMSVPIALAVNIGRVTALGMLVQHNRAWASGDLHTLVGMAMLVPAAGLFWLLGWVLDRLVVEHEGAPPAQHAANAATARDTGAVSEPPAMIVRPMALGLALTFAVGAAYVMLLAAVRPDRLGRFAPQVGESVMRVAAIVAVVVCAVSAVVIVRALRKLLAPASKGRPGVAGLPMGVAAGVLAGAVLGLSGMQVATKAVLIKDALPLRHSLELLPQRVGSWEQVGEQPPLSAEELEALGTRNYISRTYRDSATGWAVHLHVAYYTGTPDTVPHVPDRCFVAGGLLPVDTTRASVTLEGPTYRAADEGGAWAVSRLAAGPVYLPATTIPATLFRFAYPHDPTRAGSVIYFFSANGKFLPTPDHVRLQGFDLRDRYAYYCKIEVAVDDVADPAAAAQRVSMFLSTMAPEIMACLPDWREVER